MRGGVAYLKRAVNALRRFARAIFLVVEAAGRIVSSACEVGSRIPKKNGLACAATNLGVYHHSAFV